MLPYDFVWESVSIDIQRKKKNCLMQVFKFSSHFFLLFFMIFLFGFCQDSPSLCSPSCPRTPSVDQADIELTETHLPLLPSTEINSMHHHDWPIIIFFKYCLGNLGKCE